MRGFQKFNKKVVLFPWMNKMLFWLTVLAVSLSVAHSDEDCPGVEIVSRREWNARQPFRFVEVRLPLNHVVILHTVTHPCNSKHHCSRNIQLIQDIHLDERDVETKPDGIRKPTGRKDEDTSVVGRKVRWGMTSERNHDRKIGIGSSKADLSVLPRMVRHSVQLLSGRGRPYLRGTWLAQRGCLLHGLQRQLPGNRLHWQLQQPSPHGSSDQCDPQLAEMRSR